MVFLQVFLISILLLVIFAYVRDFTLIHIYKIPHYISMGNTASYIGASHVILLITPDTLLLQANAVPFLIHFHMTPLKTQGHCNPFSFLL